MNDIQGIRKVIRVLKHDGWTLDSVYNGDEDIPVATEQAAIEEITSVDMAYLHVTRGDVRGWALFVLGNGPGEVLCDHTLNLTPLIDLELE